MSNFQTITPLLAYEGIDAAHDVVALAPPGPGGPAGGARDPEGRRWRIGTPIS